MTDLRSSQRISQHPFAVYMRQRKLASALINTSGFLFSDDKELRELRTDIRRRIVRGFKLSNFDEVNTAIETDLSSMLASDLEGKIPLELEKANTKLVRALDNILTVPLFRTTCPALFTAASSYKDIRDKLQHFRDIISRTDIQANMGLFISYENALEKFLTAMGEKHEQYKVCDATVSGEEFEVVHEDDVQSESSAEQIGDVNSQGEEVVELGDEDADSGGEEVIPLPRGVRSRRYKSQSS